MKNSKEKYLYMRHSTTLFLLFILVVSCKTNKVEGTHSNINTLNFEGEYEIRDAEFGTNTVMQIIDNERVLTTNSIPNHKTGNFPNEGNPNKIQPQNLKYTFPLEPKYVGKAKWVREFGVAVNGIKFEPETAERFICETGEVYRVEAKQDLINLGLDENNAHVQPSGAYHYHGLPLNLIVQLSSESDLILLGYAKDGFPIYYSKSDSYKPSYALKKEERSGTICEYRNPHQTIVEDYDNTTPNGIFVSDWEYVEGSGHLDECNGMFLNNEYVYFVTLSYPFIGRCLKGEFTELHPKGPPPNRNPNRLPHRNNN